MRCGKGFHENKVQDLRWLISKLLHKTFKNFSFPILGGAASYFNTLQVSIHFHAYIILTSPTAELFFH